MGYNRNVPSDPAHTDTVAYIAEKKMQRKVKLHCLLDSSTLLEVGVEVVDVDAGGAPQLSELDVEIFGLMSKLAEADMDNAALKTENSTLKDQNAWQTWVKEMKADAPDGFNGGDDKVWYYTGLPSWVTLMALCNLLASEISGKKNSSLSKFQKLVVTLMCLRLNLSWLCTLVIQVMHAIIQSLQRWPERGELQMYEYTWKDWSALSDKNIPYSEPPALLAISSREQMTSTCSWTKWCLSSAHWQTFAHQWYRLTDIVTYCWGIYLLIIAILTNVTDVTDFEVIISQIFMIILYQFLASTYNYLKYIFLLFFSLEGVVRLDVILNCNVELADILLFLVKSIRIYVGNFLCVSFLFII